LDESTISRFINAMTPVKFKKDDQIVQKGQVGTVFYIIQEGKVKIHDIGLGDSQYEDQIFGPGDSFGERALLTGEPRAANATALTDVSTLAMDRETFEETIGPLQG
jgi:CRP-like cAMP-binding protein